MEIIFIIIFLSFFVFFGLHLRPLRDNEIDKLVKIRRNKKCEKYYKHSKQKIEINPKIKKKMNPDGEFRIVNLDLYSFPALVAGMLKYKKHEWIMIAFERNRIIEYAWLNKGPNKNSVYSKIKAEDMIEIAKHKEFKSIIVFHNHPNPEGSLFYALPSGMDEQSASNFGSLLKNYDLNLIEFICDRGRAWVYYFSFSEKFFPEEEIRIKINAENRKSLLKNFSLHCERIFNTPEIRLI